MDFPLVRLALGGACLDVRHPQTVVSQACGSESHNIINPLNNLTKLTKMIPESPYTTPFIATSGIIGTLSIDHINTSVAIGVGVLTMVYLGIKIYKEISKK